jgi:hypothetical protein
VGRRECDTNIETIDEEPNTGSALLLHMSISIRDAVRWACQVQNSRSSGETRLNVPLANRGTASGRGRHGSFALA